MQRLPAPCHILTTDLAHRTATVFDEPKKTWLTLFALALFAVFWTVLTARIMLGRMSGAVPPEAQVVNFSALVYPSGNVKDRVLRFEADDGRVFTAGMDQLPYGMYGALSRCGRTKGEISGFVLENGHGGFWPLSFASDTCDFSLSSDSSYADLAKYRTFSYWMFKTWKMVVVIGIGIVLLVVLFNFADQFRQTRP